ncbi:MAG: sigma-54 dependent transcriptional regulator [Muribaculum sp.]|nr:sigma-54 dependent transcriptional regulator [Muribaculum sp.]
MNNQLSEDALRAKQRFSIIGNSRQLAEAIQRAVTVAPIDLSVLVYGESGSGKEFFPKIIHYFGARKHKKYIAVNCGAIPEGTIDSELFGHEKGAFTGAVATRKGYFEEADGGTIFLDEVAELPLTTQARLLRVLETGEFLKVGSSVVQKTNIRVVAATNVDLLKAVEKGKFREDLYYRLSTILITVPPLRDRGDDIQLLARKFAADFAEKYMTAPVSFSSEALHALSLYSWPGNVRQLKNVVEQIALFEAGQEISRHNVIDALPLRNPDSSGADSLPSRRDSHDYESEREFLWQSIFQLRAEIAELRQSIHPTSPLKAIELLSGPDDPGSDMQHPQSPIPRSSSLTPFSQGGTTLEDSERQAVADALARNNGNKRAAATELNISLRTLYRKIHDLGLDNQPN